MSEVSFKVVALKAAKVDVEEVAAEVLPLVLMTATYIYGGWSPLGHRHQASFLLQGG